MLQRKTIGNSSGPPAPFIVGTGRCGSTLLRLMLDAHPELAIPPETHFIIRLMEEHTARPQVAPDEFAHLVTGHYSWPDFHLDAQSLRNEIGTAPLPVGDALRVFYRCYARRQQKKRWGDKTPDYLEIMTAIHAWLPEAHFVHLVRDGRDVALSVKDLWWGPSHAAEAATWWVRHMEAARAQAALLPNYYEMRYEDLVADAEQELQQVCYFLDLQFHPAMLRHEEGARERLDELSTVERDGRVISREARLETIRLAVRRLDPTRSARWRREMSPADREIFREIAGEWLKEFGYEG